MEKFGQMLDRFLIPLTFLPLIGLPWIMGARILDGYSKADAILIGLGTLLPVSMFVLLVHVLVMDKRNK